VYPLNSPGNRVRSSGPVPRPRSGQDTWPGKLPGSPVKRPTALARRLDADDLICSELRVGDQERVRRESVLAASEFSRRQRAWLSRCERVRADLILPEE
jgi:hypothetical protein